MPKKQPLKKSDRRWIERLNRHPHLKQRFEAILQLADHDGPGVAHRR